MNTVGWLHDKRGEVDAAISWYRKAADAGSAAAALSLLRLQQEQVDAKTVSDEAADGTMSDRATRQRADDGGPSGMVDHRFMTANTQLDEGLRQAGEGRGASALVSSEQGILVHLKRCRGTRPFDATAAAALARHAEVLHRFGDPDLAVAAADLALRIWLKHRSEIDIRLFARAARIASDIHGASGRTDIAQAAERLLHKVGSEGAVGAPPLAEPEPLLGRVSLAQALERVQPPPDVAQDQLPSPKIFVEALTAPATDCSLIATSMRCAPEDLPMVAGLLAAFAEGTFERDPAAGLRLGLEAHVLYAHGSEIQIPAMRYQMYEHGPRWARVLQACARHSDSSNNEPLTSDLAAWMAGVVHGLMPFVMVDHTVRSTVTHCISWHADLLQRTGDLGGAADVRQALSHIRQMG